MRARLALCKRRITRRLDKADLGVAKQPLFTASNIRDELADEARSIFEQT